LKFREKPDPCKPSIDDDAMPFLFPEHFEDWMRAREELIKNRRFQRIQVRH